MPLVNNGPKDAPIAIELLGESGSGKSSLRGALVDRSGGSALPVRLRGEIGFAAVGRNALVAGIPFLSQLPYLPARRWYRYTLMVHLGCYRDALRGLQGRCEVAVLDQGPVYLLEILQRALQESSASNARRFLRYWSDQVELWSRTLRLVAVLSAPDEILYDRIQRRGTPNPLLGRSLAEAKREFARKRRSRDRILEQMRLQFGGPITIEIRTDTVTPEGAADLVSAHLGVTLCGAAGGEGGTRHGS